MKNFFAHSGCALGRKEINIKNQDLDRTKETPRFFSMAPPARFFQQYLLCMIFFLAGGGGGGGGEGEIAQTTIPFKKYWSVPN